MNKMWLLLIPLVAGAAWLLLPGPAPGQAADAVTIYKSASCGCCVHYAAYLGDQGYRAETVITEDMEAVKQKYGIPVAMQSCHTAVIGGYFVEGHVPVEAVQKLLRERPDIDGIALPGMPSGAPGMPGTKTKQFVVHALTGGRAEEFMVL